MLTGWIQRGSFVVLSFFFMGRAHAASFDCGKAQRPVEKAICGNVKLNTADEQMGRVYRSALARLSSASVGLLRADQVQWLAWAQEVCHADDAGTPAAAMVKCLLPAYDERTKQLRQSVIRRADVTFLTRTQFLASPGSDPADMDGPEYAGFGVLKANWPVADSNDAKWTAWSTAMEAHAFLLAGGSAESAVATPSSISWTASLAQSQDSEVIGHIKSVENARVTVTLNTEVTAHGGAHPSEAFQTLTWLLDKERLLTADDVFKPGNAWRQAVADACWKAISTGEQKTYLYPEVTGSGAKQLQDVIGNTTNWTLETDGLHISYPEYSVAPRVSPVDDTVIPWPELQSVLVPNFAVPPPSRLAD